MIQPTDFTENVSKFEEFKYERQHAETQQEEKKDTDKFLNIKEKKSIRRWMPQKIVPGGHLYHLWQEAKAIAWVHQVQKTHL